MAAGQDGPNGAPVIGWVDLVSGDMVQGWCARAGWPGQRIAVQILEDGRVIASGVAELYRADLLELGGDGCHGFILRLPARLRDGRTHRLDVAAAEDGTPLQGSPFDFHLAEPDLAYVGAVETMDADGISGWVVNEQRPDETPILRLHDGEGVITTFPAGEAMPDRAGYRFSLPLPRRLLDGRTHMLSVSAGPKSVPLEQAPRAFSLHLAGDSVDIARLNHLAEQGLTSLERVGQQLDDIAVQNKQALQFNQMAAEAVLALKDVVRLVDRRVEEIHEMVGGLRPTEAAVPGQLLDQLRMVAEEFRRLAPPIARFGALRGATGATLVEEFRRQFPELAFGQKEEPVVSIVIAAFNQFSYTYQCLRALTVHRPLVPFEVILVDDASTDETVLASYVLPDVRIIRNAANRGFIDSCNLGTAQARGTHLLFLNNDTIVSPGAVDALYETFAADPLGGPEVGLAGAKLLNADGTLQEAGGVIWRDASGMNYGLGGDPEHCDYNYRRSVDYCSGAAIMVPKALFDAEGGFDPAFHPAYYEDTDLAFRLRRRGFAVYYQPQSVVIHYGGVTHGVEEAGGLRAHFPDNARRFEKKWREVLKGHAQRGGDVLLERDRGARHRALFIDATTPEPDKDAGSTVALAHMRILQSMGFKVTFIPEDNFAQMRDYTPRLQAIGVECIYHPYWSGLEEFVAARGAEFDLIYIHRFEVAERSLPVLRKHLPSVPILFNNADLHYLRAEREARLRSSPADLAKAAETKARELSVVEGVDCTILCSTVEEDVLAKDAPNAPVYYFPWAIEAQPLPRPSFESREGFMFLGGFGHPPNGDAVNHFICDILPHLRKRLPHVKFYIYGSRMPDEIRRLASSNIVPVGFVANLADAFDRHRVSIAPLRYGAGFKGKLAASLSYGLPAVTTGVAAEGTGLIHNRHLLVADTPEAFAESLAALYTDKALWNRLAEGGRSHVEEHYSFSAGRRRFNEIFRKIGRPAFCESEVIEADFRTRRELPSP